MTRAFPRAAVAPFFRAPFATALLVFSSSSHPAVSFSSAIRNNNAFLRSVSFADRASLVAPRQATVSSTTTTVSTLTPVESTAESKLKALREKLVELDLDVYIVPSDDPHLSEYTPLAYRRRGFLTDFHGSAGTALVTRDGAFLWTDSRYFNEASLALDADHWKLMKLGQKNVPTIIKFLGQEAVSHYKNSSKPLRVGIDPFVHAASFANDLNEAFQSSATQELNNADIKIGELVTEFPNLIDPIWGDVRPPIPKSPFRVHPVEYAGLTVAEKVSRIRGEMEKKKATLAVFCTLDDVAYLLNVRAMGDVETCPVGIAYATVSTDEITLYCDEAKVDSPEVKEHLANVTLKSYDEIVSDVQAHCQDDTKVWVDKKNANLALVSVIPDGCLVDGQNAITPMKACKNMAELEGMRKAHIVDGAAMAKFMCWLEKTIKEEGRSVSEVEIDEVLTGFRAKQPGFLEVSFPTIAGVGSNGAIIHYRAKEGSDILKYLDTSNPILIDSGAQYTYGTTDVTRTWHFGTASPEFIDYYTRVLKGNIGVDTMIFPENTPGFVLDVFARKSLWQAGKDYGHGTGHGVGAALNVHEGPQSISPRWANKEFLKQGMVVSNEPGYYEDGKFGIRIENLLEVQSIEPSDEASKKFFKFEKLTHIPIQKNLINIDLMTNEELDWLDEYHQQVMDKVGPLLEDNSPAKKWLEKACAKIDRKG